MLPSGWIARAVATSVPPKSILAFPALPRQPADPRAMPLADFIDEVMQILRTQPDVQEICVERVKPLRFSAESGKFDATFQGLNQSMPAPE